MSKRRLAYAIAGLATALLVGTAGYSLIEHWSVADAVYMTVITVATVGFTEVHPLTAAGRTFTMALIALGLAAQAFALSTIIDFFVAGHLQEMLEGRRMNKRIEGLSGHTIVAGIGRVGYVVAKTLHEEGDAFVIIDRTEEALRPAHDAGWLYVQGEAAEEETLIAAGVERARALVTAVDSDADNLFITVSARALNPDVFIVARSSHQSSEPKLLKAGANRVLTPNVIGGRRMAAMVAHPVVSDYLDIVAHGQGVEFRLQEVDVAEGSSLAGKTIAQARVRERTGIYILAISRADGSVDANPPADAVLSVGDTLVVLGTPSQLEEFDGAV
jgi:voltage-gated potassium channel